MGNLRAIEGGEGDGAPPELGVAEYVWPDQEGAIHTRLRPIEVYGGIPRIERWAGVFPTQKEEVVLHPGQYLPDPLRGQPSYMVLCEAMSLQGVPHESNTRIALRDYLGAAKDKPAFRDWFDLSFELRYWADATPPGFRAAEKFTGACVDAGIMVYSATYYDGPGTWALRIGPRGVSIDPNEPDERTMTIADHVLIARAFFDKAMRECGVESGFHASAAIIGGERNKLAEVLEKLRLRWQADLKIEGIEVLLDKFDPYTTTVRLMTHLRALEHEE
jgi:glutamine synthetase